MPSASPESQETAWCAGIPQSGRRELTPEEVAALRTMSARFQLQGRGAFVVVGALLLWSAVIGLQYAARPVIPPGAAFGLFLSVCIVPLGVMLTRDWLNRSRLLRQDADAGWLRQFTGTLPTDRITDETRDRMLRRRLLVPDPSRIQWFEVMPHSDLVWSANGYRSLGWVRAVPNVLAGLPEYAATAAQWVSPVQQPGSEGVHLNFRDLSPAERGEIRKHSHRLLLKPLGSALLFTVWAIFPMVSDSFKEMPAAVMVFGAFAGWSWWNVFRVFGTATKLRRDAEVGRVVIVRREVDLAAAPTPFPNLSPPDEFLPESGIPWTVSEKPAGWRLTTGNAA